MARAKSMCILSLGRVMSRVELNILTYGLSGSIRGVAGHALVRIPLKSMHYISRNKDKNNLQLFFDPFTMTFFFFFFCGNMHYKATQTY